MITMSPNFSDHLTFHLAPSSCQNVQIILWFVSAKLMTLLSVSTVFSAN